jgi:hypothetical protein
LGKAIRSKADNGKVAKIMYNGSHQRHTTKFDKLFPKNKGTGTTEQAQTLKRLQKKKQRQYDHKLERVCRESE